MPVALSKKGLQGKNHQTNNIVLILQREVGGNSLCRFSYSKSKLPTKEVTLDHRKIIL